MIYKNLSNATKTFYGVTFKPGEECEVPGYVNDPKFIRLKEFTQKPVEIPEFVEQSAEIQTVSIKKLGRAKKEVITDGTNSS
ncbi:MAG: hypothetical protein NC227_10915 [Bacteroides sp.]|nr:hypothetical protein [Bacteroides sp.]MCM1361782.1 hypothetical protein [Clostridiales bacterium]